MVKEGREGKAPEWCREGGLGKEKRLKEILQLLFIREIFRYVRTV